MRGSFLRRRVLSASLRMRLRIYQSRTCVLFERAEAVRGSVSRPPVHTGGSVSMNAKSVLFETTEREDV
jgi:hypothetical protein